MHRAPPFVYKTNTLQVRAEALPEVICALQKVAAHVNRCERGTRLCAWFQAKDEPTTILQLLVFDDEEAERAHHISAPAQYLDKLLENGSGQAKKVTEWCVLAGI